MHDIEKVVATLIESGKCPDIESLGGLDEVISARGHLTKSPLSPHIASAALAYAETSDETVRALAGELVCDCFRDAPDDLTLFELNSVLEWSGVARGRIGDTIFRSLTDRLHTTNAAAARGACLDGLLRLASASHPRQLRLAAELLDTNVDDPAVQPMMAKGLGIVWSQVRDNALVERLQILTGTEAGAAEAAFELGMAHLVLAFEAKALSTAQADFTAAKRWFDHSLAESEERPAAKLYSLGIAALLDLGAPDEATRASFAAPLLAAAFDFQAYNSHTTDEPAWLGARRVEAVRWTRLALTVDSLARKLWEPAWWEPAAVIAAELLAIYSASRTILERDRNGGLESLIQPRLEASLLSRAGQLHQLKQWVAHNPSDAQVGDAQALLARIDELAAELLTPRRGGQSGRAGSPASIVPQETQGRLEALLQSFITDVDRRLSAPVQERIDECLEALDGHPDVAKSGGLKMFVGQILYFTACFVVHCIDRASPADPLTSYLFELDVNDLPKEGKLQHHYATVMSAWMGQAGVEVRAVGGGRADVVFTRNGDRFVVEVKRESEDASPEALFTAYGPQAEEYQNAGIRVGILLVLDLTHCKGQGLHLRESIATRSVRRHGESADRLLFLVKVSGRRKRPSDLTT